MRPTSSNFATAIANSQRRIAEVTITLPGEVTATVIDIEEDDCTVTMSGSNGSRYAASLALSPDSDTFELAATPGAEFRIRAGIDYGGGQQEWVDCGVLYAVDGDRDVALGDFPLTLQDGAVRLEECRFSSPWSVAGGTNRSTAIAAMVSDASPAVVVRQLAAASSMGPAVYERDRLSSIAEVAQGGALDAAFDAAGQWVIRDSPIITPATPSWVLKTGEQGTILPGAKRQIPLNRLYNRVVVLAPEEFQTWGAITVDIADTSNPRHRSKIGIRPFFVIDPTIGSEGQARLVAQTTLVRLLTVVESIQVPTIGNPALEYGDTIAVVHQATESDPGLQANYLVQDWTFNLGTGAMDISGRSTDQPAIEETG